MYTILSDPPGRHRRARLKAAIQQGLRELGIGLTLLNHQVSTAVDLKDADFDSLNLIARHGPISPSDLARRSGLHPATITGVLDRLESRGWVARERDPRDRRAVRVHSIPTRAGQIPTLFAGMNRSLRRILSSYSDEELAVIADFLERATIASQRAAAELSDSGRR